MSTQSVQGEQQRDYFWLYIAGFTVALVGVIAMVKMSENEKYEPIKQQLAEESGKMNIRVIKEY